MPSPDGGRRVMEVKRIDVFLNPVNPRISFLYIIVRLNDTIKNKKFRYL